MKRRTVLLLLLALAVGWLFHLTGCSLMSVTVDDRVMQFLSDINDSDRSQVYLNFHPDIFDYGLIPAFFWDSLFAKADAPYFISALVTDDPANVTFTLTNSGAGDWAVRFVMMKLGNDWMIWEMYLDLSPGPPTTLIVH